MAETKNNEKGIQEIKSLLKTEKVVLGTEKTLKELKGNQLATVYLSSNTPADVEENLNYYGELAGTDVIKLSVPNDELGVLCQKPFYISVIGIRK